MLMLKFWNDDLWPVVTPELDPISPPNQSSGINISDVNSSLRQFIRRRYWWEILILAPLIVAWEYLIIRYVGPLLFSGHASGSSGKGFAELVILPIGLVLSWFYRLKKKFEDVFLAQFASTNGYQYEPTGSVADTYGCIFRANGVGTVSDVVSGTYLGDNLRLFLYDLKIGVGRNQRMYRNTVLELTLSGKLPHLLLTSRRSRNFGLNLGALSGIDGTISLEGNFDKDFTLHAPLGTQIEALEVFAPNVMALLQDESRGFDVEFVANRIYIYLGNYIATTADVERIFGLARNLIASVGPVAARLANDAAVEVPATVSLYQPRQRARLGRLATVTYLVFVVGLLGAGIALGFWSAHNQPLAQASTNPAYDAAAKQAEVDLAASSDTDNRGTAIVSDGQQALAAATTRFGRSGAYYYIARGYFWERNYTMALDNANLALTNDATNQGALEVAANALINLDRPAEAIAMADRELSLDATDGSAYRAKAFAQANLGQQAAALTTIW